MFSTLQLRQFTLIPDDAPEPELIRNAPPENVALPTCAAVVFGSKNIRKLVQIANI
jgi:hypothetical protein